MIFHDERATNQRRFCVPDLRVNTYQEVARMFRGLTAKFFRRTHPIVLTSLFVSAVAPSIFLVYTGIYGIWCHLLISIFLTCCFLSLLFHHLGYRDHLRHVGAPRPSSAPPLNAATGVARVISKLDYEFQKRGESLQPAFSGESSGAAMKNQPVSLMTQQ